MQDNGNRERNIKEGSGLKPVNVKRLTLTAILIVLALMFSYIEVLIPVTFGIPGFKIGLANIMTVFALYLLDVRYALAISLVRIALSALLFGNPFSLLYSLAGGALSLAGMWLLKKTGLFSVIGVSMAGGVLHNSGQMGAAMLLITPKIITYYPALFFAGIATGILTGVISHVLIYRLTGITPSEFAGKGA